MNNAPIGVFDSGSGGLSILLSLRAMLSQQSVVYLGDHMYNPYGGKTGAFIRKRVLQCIEFLRSKQVKLIVIACNTATIAGIDLFRKFNPDIPIIGVVPVVKTAVQVSTSKNVVILSTEYTARSTYQKKLIRDFAQGCNVTSIGSSKLVPLIEKGILSGDLIMKELHKIFKRQEGSEFDVVALGCTHYPFIRNAIQKVIGNNVRILDSSEAVARQVVRVLTARNEHSHGVRREEYYTTGEKKLVCEVFDKLLHTTVHVDHVTL